MVGARIAGWKLGDNQFKGSANFPTQEQTSALLNIGERSIRSARHVREHGDPVLEEAVIGGVLEQVKQAQQMVQSEDHMVTRLRAEAPGLG
jgi:hypothetical protein